MPSRTNLASGLDGSIKILEELIQTMEVQLSSLRQDKNASLPAIKLPDELLLVIFQWCADYQRPAPSYYRSIRTLRLVCSRWASLIADSPPMWSPIYCGHPKDVQRALRLSRDAPLYVQYRPGTRGVMPVDQYLELTQLDAGRWKSLTLNDVDKDLVTRFLESPAGSLRSLSIETKAPVDLSSMVKSLFSNSAPSLNHLRLTGCALPWGVINATAMESLKLYSVPIGLPDIRTILSTTMALKSFLYVSFAECMLSHADTSVHDGIRLPNLRSLGFIGPSDFGAGLLEGLHAPNLKALTLSNGHKHQFQDSFLPWIRQVTTSFTSRHLKLRTYSHGFELALGGLDICYLLRPSNPLPIIQKVIDALPTSLRASIVSTRWRCHDEVKDVLPLVCHAFPNIQTLWWERVDECLLEHVGSLLPDLKTLRVTYGANVFKAFGPQGFRSISRVEIGTAKQEDLQSAKLKYQHITWASWKFRGEWVRKCLLLPVMVDLASPPDGTYEEDDTVTLVEV